MGIAFGGVLSLLGLFVQFLHLTAFLLFVLNTRVLTIALMLRGRCRFVTGSVAAVTDSRAIPWLHFSRVVPSCAAVVNSFLDSCHIRGVATALRRVSLCAVSFCDIPSVVDLSYLGAVGLCGIPSAVGFSCLCAVGFRGVPGSVAFSGAVGFCGVPSAVGFSCLCAVGFRGVPGGVAFSSLCLVALRVVACRTVASALGAAVFCCVTLGSIDLRGVLFRAVALPLGDVAVGGVVRNVSVAGIDHAVAGVGAGIAAREATSVRQATLDQREDSQHWSDDTLHAMTG